MRKFLQYFLLKNKSQSDQYPEHSNPMFHQQLSQKARHPSSIPKSFLERDEKFKQNMLFGNRTVLPRTNGMCQFKIGKRGKWRNGSCCLESSHLKVKEKEKDGNNDRSHTSRTAPSLPDNEKLCNKDVVDIVLVGSHLEAEKAPDEFMIRDGQGTVVYFRPESPKERDEWFVALGHVPGIFRRLEDYYVLGKHWGHGATCEVCECVGRYTGKRFAVKRRLHITREATEAMHNELRILQICAKYPHPAIPRLEEFFFDTSGRVEIVMELMEGGELFNYIVESQHLSEGKARTVFRQIVAGVAHLHSIGIAHRDLKPQNLMYCRISDSNRELGQIKIIDYDLARVNHSPQWEGSTPCGTMYYMAPEVVHGEVYSLGIDCWSLGVILYILLSGELPFQGPDEKHIAALIRNGKYSLEGSAWEHVSQNAKFLVKGLLEVNPNHRLTAVQCLQHPWLQELTQDSIADLVEAARDSTAGERPQMTSIPDGKLKTIENLKRLSLTREASGSLTKALDYDLEALRHEEPPGKPLTGSVDAKDIARLKVTLDLVGRHAGLQDSWTNSPSKGGSPVYSPSKCRLSRDSKDPWQHEFDDLGASVTFVEEETDVISPKVPR